MTGPKRKPGAIPVQRKAKGPLPPPRFATPEPEVEPRKCRTCGGNGELYVVVGDGSRTRECWTCDGTGLGKDAQATEAATFKAAVVAPPPTLQQGTSLTGRFNRQMMAKHNAAIGSGQLSYEEMLAAIDAFDDEDEDEAESSEPKAGGNRMETLTKCQYKTCIDYDTIVTLPHIHHISAIDAFDDEEAKPKAEPDSGVVLCERPDCVEFGSFLPAPHRHRLG